MKFKNNSEMEKENIFGNALEKLMNAVRNRYTRRDWTILLGVSDAAISQWTKGKTFPAADKLEILITILKSHNLNREEQKAYDSFIALLETPVEKLWSKLPGNMEGKKLSDYVLQNTAAASDNTMSGMYYDLKLLLYQDLSRQVDIHTNYLYKFLLNETVSDDDSFYEMAIRKRKLLAAFSDENNSDKLTGYASKVRVLYKFFNILLDRILADGSGNYDPGLMRDLLMEVFDQQKDQMIKNLSATKSKTAEASSKLDDYFKMERKDHACELSFFLPGQSEKELVNISFGKIITKAKSKPDTEFPRVFLNCEENIDFEDLYKIKKIPKNAVPITGITKHSEDKSTLENYLLNFDLLPDMENHSYRRKSSIQSAFNSVYEVFANRTIDSKSIKKCLVTPAQTNERYSVEIFGAVNAKTRNISRFENGIVWVIFGNLELYNHRYSKPIRLGSMIDELENSGDNRTSNCALVQNNEDYQIKNIGGDYLALLVKDLHGNYPESLYYDSTDF